MINLPNLLLTDPRFPPHHIWYRCQTLLMAAKSRGGGGAPAGTPPGPLFGMYDILGMLFSIALISVATGWAFGEVAAGGAGAALVTLTGALVLLRMAKASHLSTALLIMAVAVLISAAGYKWYQHNAAESRKHAAAIQTLDVSGRVTVHWNGAFDIGNSGLFTLAGVSGFQKATTTFQVTDEYPARGTCAAHTTLTVATGPANNPQDAVTVGPFTDPEQTIDLTIPAGSDVLDGTVSVQNAQAGDYLTHCPVWVVIKRVIIHH